MKSRLGKLVLVVVIAALLTATAKARAEVPAAAMAEAREHYRKGTQLYDLGRYLEAVTEYEAAFRLSELPGFLLNIGQAYRLADKPREARAAYQGFLRRVPDAPQRAETEQYIAELARKIDEETARAAAEQRAAAERAAAVVAVVTPEPPPVARRRTKRWVWGVVGASAFVVVGVAVGVGLALGLSPHYPSSPSGSKPFTESLGAQ